MTSSEFPRPEEPNTTPPHFLGTTVEFGALEGNQNPDYLTTEKQAMYEQSEKAGKVEFVGVLKDIVPGAHRAEWTGAISVKNRLASGELQQDKIEWLRQNIGKYYRGTSEGAMVRCIDGRTEEGYDDSDPAKFDAKLGPQIPGGTLAGGVSYRHAVSSSYKDFSIAKLANDSKTFGEKSQNNGFVPGDHSARGHGKLGCGAVDGIEATHDKVNPNNIPVLHGLTSAILGDGFRENHFTHFTSSANLLSANDSYFASKQEAIDYLAATHPGSLPELAGAHKEVFLMINTVENTTVHRDHLNAQSDSELQVFGYDLWYTQKMAKQLFPDSTEAQELYVHCRVAMAVAAIMYLTDGTLEVGVRSPQKDYNLAA